MATIQYHTVPSGTIRYHPVFRSTDFRKFGFRKFLFFLKHRRRRKNKEYFLRFQLFLDGGKIQEGKQNCWITLSCKSKNSLCAYLCKYVEYNCNISEMFFHDHVIEIFRNQIMKSTILPFLGICEHKYSNVRYSIGISISVI